MLTRRTVLVSAAASGLAVLAACTRGTSSGPTAGSASTTAPDGPGLRVTGAREQVLAADRFGMLNFPDGHLTYLSVDGGYRAWLSSGLPGGGGRTVALDTDDLLDFRPAVLDGADAVAGLVPPGGQEAFDSDYSAPGSVFASADGSSLWLVYHGENHTFAGITNDGSPFYATIGLASSTDGGLTWERRGAVVTGQVPRDDQPAPRDVVGAGSPCAVVADGTVYVFYMDWSLGAPDEIHVARAPLDAVADPGAWVKFYEGSFSTQGSGGFSTAVVGLPGPREETVVAGGPSVSWNSELGCWLMVFQSQDGFWWTCSTDLTDWADAVRFLDAGAAELGGAPFVAYGTLLSPGAPDDQVTGRDAQLYLAVSENDRDSHSLWRIPVTVTAG